MDDRLILLISCWLEVRLGPLQVCHCQTESFEVFGFVCSFERAPAGCTDTAKLMVTLVTSPIGISHAYLFRIKVGVAHGFACMFYSGRLLSRNIKNHSKTPSLLGTCSRRHGLFSKQLTIYYSNWCKFSQKHNNADLLLFV